MSIRVLKSTEQFSATQKVNGKKVEATWSVKANKDEKTPRYVLSSTFDFSACSQEEIIGLAMKAVVIEVQRQWRDLAAVKGSTATTVNPFKMVNVKSAIVDATRKTANPKARAAALLNKMSAEDRKAILEMFKASIAAGKKSA